MFNKQNGESLPRGDVYDHEKALKALAKMKTLEEEMAPRMTTIVTSNGAVISSTNADWLRECKTRHERVIKIIK